MTPYEFSKRMRDIFVEYGEDEEVAHLKMDQLMSEVLIELGYGVGIALFNKQKKWYS